MFRLALDDARDETEKATISGGLVFRFFRPFQGSCGSDWLTQGLRPGLHSWRRFAAQKDAGESPAATQA
jgi:hypothetical protein